jgi:hypothetical protein
MLFPVAMTKAGDIFNAFGKILLMISPTLSCETNMGSASRIS